VSSPFELDDVLSLALFYSLNHRSSGGNTTKDNGRSLTFSSKGRPVTSFQSERNKDTHKYKTMNANAPAFVPGGGGSRKEVEEKEKEERGGGSTTTTSQNRLGKVESSSSSSSAFSIHAPPPPPMAPPPPPPPPRSPPPPSLVNNNNESISTTTSTLFSPSPPRKLSQDVLTKSGSYSRDDDESEESSSRAGRMMTPTKKKEDANAIPKYDLEKHFKTVLPLGPPLKREEDEATGALDKLGVEEGRLPNGLRYFVGQCKKPEKRAALALAVDVGSVFENEEERGVAHIVEHLAFRATTSYETFQIVNFLESVGAAFGACQNAYTSSDETVFELTVPIDDMNVLEESLKIFSEFARGVRISDEDVDNERGAVLEEWRSGRDARGRAAQAYWEALCEGSLYADRSPIGTEEVIRKAPGEIFRNFYHKWYRPENMAVIVTGDFEDVGVVKEKIIRLFSPLAPAEHVPAPPKFIRPTFPEHAKPRVCCHVDRELSNTVVNATFHVEQKPIATPEDFFKQTVQECYQLCLDNRLYKLMRRPKPNFFSAGIASEHLSRTSALLSVQMTCEASKVKDALESVLTEVSRARLFGFSAQELRIAKLNQIADMEQLYVERDQTYCTDARDELVQHFLRGDMVIGAGLEASLAIACIEKVTLEDVFQYAQEVSVSKSCMIRLQEGRKKTNEDDLREAVNRVAEKERRGEIEENSETFVVPERLMADPQPLKEGESAIASTRTHSISDVTEVVLKNGIKIALKSTNFLDDQVLMRVVARGGLSEVPKEKYKDAIFAGTVARELGVFGYRPEVFSDAMAGKRVDVVPNIGTYKRSIVGETSPDHIDVLLQCTHLIFSNNVENQCNEDDLEVLREIQRELVKNAKRDPMKVFAEIKRALTYGNSYLSEPITLKTLAKMDAEKACRYFNECFVDPSHFTMVLVGAFDIEKILPLLEKYIGSIPRPIDSKEKLSRVTPAPFEFPKKTVSKRVRLKMIENQGVASLTFPVMIENPDAKLKQAAIAKGEDFNGPTLAGSQVIVRRKFLTVISAAIIERRLLARLRFERGEIYSCAANTSFAYQDPNAANGESYRGDIMVVFACDPKSGEKLSKVALEEIEQLISEGPTEEDCQTAKEVELRSIQEHKEENSFWVSYVDAMFTSQLLPVLNGDIDKMYVNTEQIRGDVLETLSPTIIREHLAKTLAVERRVNVVLIPQRPLFLRLIAPNMDDIKGFFEWPETFGEACGKLALLGGVAGAYFAYAKSKENKKDK
jgi:predicted Zn-dependent peptidase